MQDASDRDAAPRRARAYPRLALIEADGAVGPTPASSGCDADHYWDQGRPVCFGLPPNWPGLRAGLSLVRRLRRRSNAREMTSSPQDPRPKRKAANASAIPAKAGIHLAASRCSKMDPGFRLASAGMTTSRWRQCFNPWGCCAVVSRQCQKAACMPSDPQRRALFPMNGRSSSRRCSGERD